MTNKKIAYILDNYFDGPTWDDIAEIAEDEIRDAKYESDAAEELELEQLMAQTSVG